MSALPNSKSSFFRAAQGCGALVLAGAMVLPMSPALAQTVAADAPAAAATGALPGDRVRENPPVATSNEFAPHWSYNALKDTDNDQVLDFSGWGFKGDINSPKGVQIVVREKGTNTPVLAISDVIEYDHEELAFAYQGGYMTGTVKIPANTLNKAKQYIVEVWGNNGYEEGSEDLVAPIIGKIPEGRGTLLASQALNFNGSDGTTAADIPSAKATQESTPTFEVLYDGKAQLLYTFEGGTVHVKGSGFTKEWREKHGNVAVYIAASRGVPDGSLLPADDTPLRFEEGKDFTIAEDGTLDAQLTVEPDVLQRYYEPRNYFPGIPRYEVDLVAEQQGQPRLTLDDLWAGKNVVQRIAVQTQAYRPEKFAPKVAYKALADTTADQDIYFSGTGFYGEIHSVKGVQYVIREKGSNTPVLATSDVIEYNHHDRAFEYVDGVVDGTVKVPANTLDASKKYVVEVWANDGYSEIGEFLAPVVGKAPEGRGKLLASQDLNFKGSDAVEDKKPSLTDEQRKERATRGELAVALYLQAGAPEVKLPETSPWPDVKTDDPNYPAYIWVREKGISYGWSDGKFHADAGISNATVAAFTYRAAGSPAVRGDSPYSDVTPGSAFYREILWASQNLPTVYGGRYFLPKQLLTRGHLETVLTAFQSRTE